MWWCLGDFIFQGSFSVSLFLGNGETVRRSPYDQRHASFGAKIKIEKSQKRSSIGDSDIWSVSLAKYLPTSTNLSLKAAVWWNWVAWLKDHCTASVCSRYLVAISRSHLCMVYLERFIQGHAIQRSARTIATAGTISHPKEWCSSGSIPEFPWRLGNLHNMSRSDWFYHLIHGLQTKTLEVDIWGIYTHDIYIYINIIHLYYKLGNGSCSDLDLFFHPDPPKSPTATPPWQAVHKTPGGETLTPQQLKVQEEFVRRATWAAKSQGQQKPGGSPELSMESWLF